MSEKHPGARKDSEGYHVYHDFGSDTTLTTTILELLEQISEGNPKQNGALNDYVDPDALDALFQPKFDGSPRDSSGYVTLTVFGYDLVVHSDGHVVGFEAET